MPNRVLPEGASKSRSVGWDSWLDGNDDCEDESVWGVRPSWVHLTVPKTHQSQWRTPFLNSQVDPKESEDLSSGLVIIWCNFVWM